MYRRLGFFDLVKYQIPLTWKTELLDIIFYDVYILYQTVYFLQNQKVCFTVGSWRRKRCQEWHRSRRSHLNYFSIWGRNRDRKKSPDKNHLINSLSLLSFWMINLVIKKILECKWMNSFIVCFTLPFTADYYYRSFSKNQKRRKTYTIFFRKMWNF